MNVSGRPGRPALVAAAWLAGAAAAGAGLGPVSAPVPNVYGPGILFALSGVDVPARAANAFVASTIEGPGLHFHLPKDPRIRVLVPGGSEALRWRIVSNDLLVADVRGDPQPLVIALAAPNVVVGRVPQGGRVASEGGGLECVVMRRAEGQRTRFAFAYDSAGGRAAADLATAALPTDLESLIENRLDVLGRLPRAPANTDPALALAMAKAVTVMKVNLCAPEGPIRTPWTVLDRWPHGDVGLWGSAFHSLGLMHLDMALARDALLAVYGFQVPGGFIPHRMGPRGTSGLAHPPVLAWAAWQVYGRQRPPDRAFLERSFEAAEKHVEWFLENRRVEGAALYAWKTGEESGAENSPRFDQGADFAAVDLSAYLANECRTLQAMAQALRYREIALKWDRKASEVEESARQHLWDERRGFFFDRRGPRGEWLDLWTYAGLLPLWAGVATNEQAARVVQHLLDKDKFWTALPVPTVARGDPTFAKDMWRGPTWAGVNYLVIRGLQRYGYTKEAEDLRQRTLRALAAWYARTGAFWEFYDPDGRTPPADLDRKGRLAAGAGWPVIGDYHATAALYVDLLMRPAP